MKKIIIIGSGGHAQVVIDIIQEMGGFEIYGITSNSLTKGDFFCGYPVLGNDSVLNDLNSKDYLVAIGIGGFTNNLLRKKIYLNIKELGYDFINVIHPSAIISKTAKLGEAVVIFAGVIVNPGSYIGNNSILATGCSVDHNTIINDHVLISAGAVIGASIEIEEGSLIALGGKIVSGIKIGKECLIAAGAVVVNDLPEKSKVFGIPAKTKE